MEQDYRIERDTMGEMHVPLDLLRGAQTARAIENFPMRLGIVITCIRRTWPAQLYQRSRKKWRPQKSQRQG